MPSLKLLRLHAAISSVTDPRLQPIQIFSSDIIYILFQYESISVKQKLRKLILDNGGRVSTVLNRKCTVVVASEDGDEFSSRLDLAFRLGIPVVVPQYISDSVARRVRLDPEEYLLLRIMAQKAFTQGKVLSMVPAKPQLLPQATQTLPTLPYSDSDTEDFELLKATILKDAKGNWFSIELLFQKPTSYCIVTHGYPKDKRCRQLSFSKAEAQETFCKHIKAKSATMSPVWDDFPAELGSPSLQQWRVYFGDVEPAILQLTDLLWSEAVGSIADFFGPNSSPPTLEQVTLAQAILEEMVAGGDETLAEEFHKVLRLEKKVSLQTTQDILEKITICRVLRYGSFITEGVHPDHPASRYFALQCHIQLVEHRQQILKLLPTLEDGVTVHNVYRLRRNVEHVRFQDEGDCRLLLHGTSPHHLVVLLSHGLLPSGGEAAATLHSLSSYALKETKPSQMSGTRFLLVCKVSLEGATQFLDEVSYAVSDPTRVVLQYLVEVSLPEDTVLPLPSTIPVKPWPLSTLQGQDMEGELGSRPQPIRVGLFSSHSGSPIPLKAFHIRAELIDLAARVNLFQEFFNPAGPCEAKFVFPLEAGATVCGFEVFINDKHVVGRVKEKAEAHRDYYTAVKQGHGGYLFDQESSDLFSVSLGNVPSHCTVLVKIVYVLELPVEDGLIRFSVPGPDPASHHIPLDLTQETTPTSQVKVGRLGETAFSAQVALEDMYEVIQRISSPTHPILVKQTQTRAVVDSAPEAHFSTTGFTLLVQLARVHVPRMWVEGSPSFPDYKACMLTFFPEFSSVEPAPHADVVLLLDVSNSMRGKPHQLMVEAADHFLESLDSHYHFNILAFGTVFQECFPTVVPASSKHLEQAHKFVHSLEPCWGTSNVERPLHYLSHMLPSSLNVLLLTDGFVSAPQTLLQGLDPRLRLFILGLGDRVDTALLRKLSARGSGSFEKIANSEAIPQKVESQLLRCRHPALTNVSIVWEEDGKREAIATAPSTIPTIYSGQRVVIYSFVHQAVMATLKGTIEGQTYETTFYSSPLHETSGTILHTLAAKAILDDWLARQEPPLDRVESQIQHRRAKSTTLKLCLKYNLVSPLTSFVAIETRDKTLPASGKQCPVEDILKAASVDHLQNLPTEIQDTAASSTTEFDKDFPPLSPRRPTPLHHAKRCMKTTRDSDRSSSAATPPTVSRAAFGFTANSAPSQQSEERMEESQGIQPSSLVTPQAEAIPNQLHLSDAILDSPLPPSAIFRAAAASFRSPSYAPSTPGFGAAQPHPIHFGSTAKVSTLFFGGTSTTSRAFSPSHVSQNVAFEVEQPLLTPGYFGSTALKSHLHMFSSSSTPPAPAFESASSLPNPVYSMSSPLSTASSAAPPPSAFTAAVGFSAISAPSQQSEERMEETQEVLGPSCNEMADFQYHMLDCEAEIHLGSSKRRKKRRSSSPEAFPLEHFFMEEEEQSDSEDSSDEEENEEEEEERDWPIVQKYLSDKLLFSTKVVDKQTLKLYLTDQLGHHGGVPICQRLLKLNDPGHNLEDFAKPEIPGETLELIRMAQGDDWISVSFELDILNPYLGQVLQDCGIKSLGPKSVRQALQLIGGVALYLYLLATWLAIHPACPLSPALGFLSAVIGRPAFAKMAANADRLPSPRSVDLGPNWEMAVLPFLRL